MKTSQMNDELAFQLIMKKLDSFGEELRTNKPSNWMSTKDVQSYTGLSKQTIYTAINKGALRVARGTGNNRFRLSWVDEWIKRK
jgi:excisionase family DNA binding protein